MIKGLSLTIIVFLNLETMCIFVIMYFISNRLGIVLNVFMAFCISLKNAHYLTSANLKRKIM